MDLSHNSHPLVCLPWAKIIAVSKERARAAAVWGWFIVSVDGYLLRLHREGCKTPMLLWAISSPSLLHRIFSLICFHCSLSIVLSNSVFLVLALVQLKGRSLMFDKVYKVNSLFCRRGFAWIAAFLSPVFMLVPLRWWYAAVFWVCGFSWFSLHDLGFKGM